jgi:hypothetical protein
MCFGEPPPPNAIITQANPTMDGRGVFACLCGADTFRCHELPALASATQTRMI